eukprot:3651770-Pleurochrysis_carterae.AAC.1
MIQDSPTPALCLLCWLRSFASALARRALHVCRLLCAWCAHLMDGRSPPGLRLPSRSTAREALGWRAACTTVQRPWHCRVSCAFRAKAQRIRYRAKQMRRSGRWLGCLSSALHRLWRATLCPSSSSFRLCRGERRRAGCWLLPSDR